MTENTGPASLYPEQSSVTEHTLQIGDSTLRYTVTAGTLPLRSADTNEIEAQIFFMAYTLTDAPANRPLTFAFNGGPGSSSVWLHLGALGPRRVKMLDDGTMPAAPYQLVDNPDTWLTFTDLVFMDPVGTGFSRASKPELNKKFWGVKGDLDSVGEAIRLYLSRYQRWASPLFLAGESYGTTRAAGLSERLVDKGIAFNGVLLISTVLNFETIRFATSDLPYLLYMPSYTATAWYHGRLDTDLQARPLPDLLREVETWLESEYTPALFCGSALPDERRRAVQTALARYTGVSETFVERCELRIDAGRFFKELLRDHQHSLGRLDARFRGLEANAAAEYPDFDPSYAAILPPYTAMLNQYVRGDLKYRTDLEYEILSSVVIGAWEWNGGGAQGYVDTSTALSSAFARNPHMRVLVAQGYYDLATPYYAALYTIRHMRLDPSLRERIRTTFYPAGHMMYIDRPSLTQLREDVESFIRTALG